jgi:hypothetical protein
MKTFGIRSTILSSLASALVLLLTGLAPAAAADERWAALSVIGDRMNLVYARMQTGTRNNANLLEAVPMKDDVLDKLALKALLKVRPPTNTEIVTLVLHDPRFYQAQEKLFTSEGKPLLDGLLKVVEAQKITHVLLIARGRGEAQFSIRDGKIGMGTIEGLGFYVDRDTRLQRTETGETDRGFIAPFAYYRLVLFDVARSAVVAESNVTASKTHLLAGSGESDPWEVRTAQQKVDDLEQLLNENMRGALQRLASARKTS